MHYNRSMWSLRTIFGFCVAAGIILSGGMLWAKTEVPYGYTFDVSEEKGESIEELILVPPPAKDNKPPLKDQIFDTKLTKELRDRYEEKFGFSPVEQIHNLPDPTAFFADDFGGSRSIQEEADEEKKFGSFVMKRMTEYHADNYFKSNPTMRPVYELKERVSKIDVKVGKSFKLSAKYSLSGNYLDLKMENPYLDSKIVLEFGESGLDDQVLVLGKRLTPSTYVETLYKNIDGIWRLTASQRIAKNLTGSLVGSTYTNGTGDSDRERLVLAGVSWSY